MQAGYMSIESVKDLVAIKEGRIIYLEQQLIKKDEIIKELELLVKKT